MVFLMASRFKFLLKNKPPRPFKAQNPWSGKRESFLEREALYRKNQAGLFDQISGALSISLNRARN
jgi:hypothetical protein